MFGRPFAHHELDEHINVKEAIAVHDALSILSWPADVAAKLLVDNTSVLYCVAKGTSKGFALNEAIGRIKACPQWAKIFSVQYIQSGKNPADWISRLFE